MWQPKAAPSLAALPKKKKDRSAVPEIPDLSEFFPLPRVAVLDLDDTCWDHLGLDHRKPAFVPPFQWSGELKVVTDSKGQEVDTFPDLPAVLMALFNAGVQVAICSHSCKPEWAKEIIQSFMIEEDTLLAWGDLVPEELRIITCDGKYWPGKQKHLEDVCTHCPGGGCQMSDILFFDDGNKLCKTAEGLGATAVKCTGGISVDKLLEGMKRFANYSNSAGEEGRGVKRKASE